MPRVSYITVKGIKPHRGVKTTIKEFRRLWLDPSLTVDQIGEILGITETAVRQRAKHRNMPDRRPIRWAAMSGFDEHFAAMFEARVSSAELARHYGLTISAVEKHARKIGVKRSRRVSRWDRGITVADYQMIRLRERMAASAREEEAALHLAEMVDGRPNNERRRAA